ncbi:hypothetical protein PR202_ga06335 [Eleusine coracana subsp. coracana]|uniref:Peptidase C1A papain C-terminal domain-containing protein n=1 Tax=Eleusine coracana subsp. coracana TaxID=191504 RepID=A0AAV5BUK6_ELECO|nr:hypothetical protein PR202_ga06335 [Eleusine coracana subsp. coracana]
MESHRAIRTGTLDLLSEQELVDCDVKSHGCKGGRAVNAFNHSARKRVAETGKRNSLAATHQPTSPFISRLLPRGSLPHLAGYLNRTSF